jgi:uncharacterized membrane protein
MWWYEHMSAWPNVSFLLFVLSVAATVGAVAWIAAQRSAAPRPTPEDVLRMRFARGEIDRETFESGLAALRDARR